MYKLLKVVLSVFLMNAILMGVVYAEPTFRDDTFLKSPDGGIHWIHSGERHAISSPAAVEYYFGMKVWNKMISVSDSLLNTIPAGGVVNLPDGALLKAPNNAAVYLFENGKRRAIPGAEMFEALYGSEGWSKVVTIGTPSLNAISLGVPVQ